MSTSFDIELFLAGVLTGSRTTRQRHLRQAKAIQTAIYNRWHRDNPWAWQQKHLAWYLNHYMDQHAERTRYYYMLTIRLLTLRLGKGWQFNQKINDGFFENRPIKAEKLGQSVVRI
ncbi:hypothetical protein PMM47T1_21713 [Pseudomonas sp. M47T1]|jgi:hypothetical protein|uniref:hypothetical protein n=1 Tax=Pseudomonas sp. M47T1 TaxID=1179778 RepID=UPI0002607003|nr:hypothetical protein [Pseudomonas sp. M47T1]EIK94552.1 hypothetical protein PMM47T1_21713 [Pseudomonas sp. M47T1]